MSYDINAARAPSMVTIAAEELHRLQRIEDLFWAIESSLPSGLESWVDDDELHELRGE